MSRKCTLKFFFFLYFLNPLSVDKWWICSYLKRIYYINSRSIENVKKREPRGMQIDVNALIACVYCAITCASPPSFRSRKVSRSLIYIYVLRRERYQLAPRRRCISMTPFIAVKTFNLGLYIQINLNQTKRSA